MYIMEKMSRDRFAWMHYTNWFKDVRSTNGLPNSTPRRFTFIVMEVYTNPIKTKEAHT